MQSLDHFKYGETQYFIGKILFQQNHLPEAKEYLSNADVLYSKDFSEGNGDDSWIEDYQDLSLTLGEVLLRLDEFEKAKEALEKAQSFYAVHAIGNIQRIEELIIRA